MFAIVMCCVVNMYLDHLKLCVVCINSRMYVCYCECFVVSNERDEPTSLTSVTCRSTMVKLCTLFFALKVIFVSWIIMTSTCVLGISILSSSSLFLIPFMLT